MGLMGLVRSPITGPAGNIEFMAHWLPGGAAGVEITQQIQACVPNGGDHNDV
jgi:hypothetical protein